MKNEIKEAHAVLSKVLDEARGAASIVISAEEMRAIRKLLDHAERTFGIPDPPPPPPPPGVVADEEPSSHPGGHWFPR